MKEIKLYTGSNCWFCEQAKQLLTRENLPFEDINLDDKLDLRMQLSKENGGYRTIPMIFIDGKFIGGFNELNALVKSGDLKS